MNHTKNKMIFLHIRKSSPLINTPFDMAAFPSIPRYGSIFSTMLENFSFDFEGWIPSQPNDKGSPMRRLKIPFNYI